MKRDLCILIEAELRNLEELEAKSPEEIGIALHEGCDD